MSGVFAKLNLAGHREILVLDPPATFEPELATLAGVRVVRARRDARQVHFALAFVTRQATLDRVATWLVGKAAGDATLWFAYPKGTSKRLDCDFNRDQGWDVLRAAGWDTVRQVSVDEDWSALRFRRQEFIQRRTRSPTSPGSRRDERA